MDLENAFSKVLKKLRKDKNLSQEELASKSGLDRTYISLLERGLRQPSLRSIFLISEALNILPEALVKLVKENYEHS